MWDEKIIIVPVHRDVFPALDTNKYVKQTFPEWHAEIMQMMADNAIVDNSFMLDNNTGIKALVADLFYEELSIVPNEDKWDMLCNYISLNFPNVPVVIPTYRNEAISDMLSAVASSNSLPVTPLF